MVIEVFIVEAKANELWWLIVGDWRMMIVACFFADVGQSRIQESSPVVSVIDAGWQGLRTQ